MTAPARRPQLGLPAAVGAYTIWGLFPPFWELMAPAGSVETLAHRIGWTFVAMLAVLAVTGRWRDLRGLPARTWFLITLASVFIAVNWGTYIWAVSHGRVVDSALGYFVNPLFSVLLAVLVLGERLRRWQWVAIAVACAACVVLAVGSGTVPWVAFVLAAAFALYGLIKKTVALEPVPGLAAEGFLLGPVSIVFLVVLQLAGTGTFLGNGVGHALLLVATGPATAVPLLLFAFGARRLSLTTLGVLQYLNPILQFGWGVLVEGEPMPPSRWLGFALVWLALMIFSVDAVRAHRTARARPPAELTPSGRAS